MTVTHTLITSGRAGTIPAAPTGGYVRTAEVAPRASRGTYLLAVSTLAGVTPNVPAISGLGTTWSIIGTAIDTELGTPDMRLVLAWALIEDATVLERILIDFAGQEQQDVCWSLSAHESSAGDRVSVGGVVANNDTTTNATTMGVALPPPTAPTSFTIIGWTGSQAITPKAGLTPLDTVSDGSQGLKTAYGSDAEPSWSGTTGANAVVFGLWMDTTALQEAVGGFLRQRQRSSEQDARRASFRNRIQ